MNWLGYLALLFSVACLLPLGRWSLLFAVAAALLGLLSAVMRHWDLVKSATESFAAKVVVVMIAAAGLFFSPWIANHVLSEITLLRPSAFPAAYSAYQYIATVLLWCILGYIGVLVLVLLNLRQIWQDTLSKIRREWYVKTQILASFSTIAGLLVLSLYLAPLLLRAANFRSGGVLAGIVVTTSFVDNGGQSIWISSIDPKFPSDCQKLAKEKGVDLAKGYLCKARTIRCSNIDRDAKIAFLDDKGAIVIARYLASDEILHELVPVRFDLAECKTDSRYDVQVSQTEGKDPPK